MASAAVAEELAVKLRILKATGREKVVECVRVCFSVADTACNVTQVPAVLEIGLVPLRQNAQYPGLFLFSTPARMMRPVVNLSTKSEELIGSFEQVL